MTGTIERDSVQADLAAIELERVLGSSEQSCFVFARLVETRAKELEAAGLPEAASLARLISDVCAYGLKYDDGREPYGPRARGDGWRTTSIEDLDDEQLGKLDAAHEHIAILELRARVADVLFVRKRRQNYATVALEAYLESANQVLASPDWVKAAHLLERALILTSSLRSERERIVRIVSDAIFSRQPDSSFFTAKMMQALLDQTRGAQPQMAAIAEACAGLAAAATDWEGAREYRLLQSNWCRRSGDETAAVSAKRAAADAYIGLADAATSRSLEANFLERAIQSLRAIGGEQATIEQLHERMLRAERESVGELKEHSRPLELGSQPERARQHVASIPLDQALVKLSSMWRPREVSAIRDSVLETARKAVMRSSLPCVRVNRFGKVVGRYGSLLSDSQEEVADALRHKMFEHAALQRNLVTIGTILPARTQITDEHYVSMRDFTKFTEASGFVPRGREEVFAFGLAAGMNGDWTTALHVLIPQFENALRTILADNGVITSRLDDDGIQAERDLGWLLTKGESNQIFGEALVFDMRGLLIERFGANLRNETSHGLIDVSQMLGLESKYFWWLTLHLVIRPLIVDATALAMA
jgi:hypothetical protein